MENHITRESIDRLSSDVEKLKTTLADLGEIVVDLQSEIAKQRLDWFRNKYTIRKNEVMFFQATYIDNVYKFKFSIPIDRDNSGWNLTTYEYKNNDNNDIKIWVNDVPVSKDDIDKRNYSGYWIVSAIQYDIKRAYDCLKNVNMA